MNKYEVIGRFIELHDGVVEITPEQAKRRGVSLANIGFGLYRIDKTVQFKVGEIIGIDYEPPKSLADFMKLIEELPVLEQAEELPEAEQVEELPGVDQAGVFPELIHPEQITSIRRGRRGRK